MKILACVSAVVALASAASACRDPLAPRPVPCPGDSVGVQVSASTAGPEFSWTPACLMGLVEVDSADFPMWLIITTDSNLVLPPVHYGATPEGMSLMGQPRSLAAGRSYTVSVWRWLSGDAHSASFKQAGTASFVRLAPADQRDVAASQRAHAPAGARVAARSPCAFRRRS